LQIDLARSVFGANSESAMGGTLSLSERSRLGLTLAARHGDLADIQETFEEPDYIPSVDQPSVGGELKN
jgi:hypothetical protein